MNTITGTRLTKQEKQAIWDAEDIISDKAWEILDDDNEEALVALSNAIAHLKAREYGNGYIWKQPK